MPLIDELNKLKTQDLDSAKKVVLDHLSKLWKKVNDAPDAIEQSRQVQEFLKTIDKEYSAIQKEYGRLILEGISIAKIYAEQLEILVKQYTPKVKLCLAEQYTPKVKLCLAEEKLAPVSVGETTRWNAVGIDTEDGEIRPDPATPSKKIHAIRLGNYYQKIPKKFFIDFKDARNAMEVCVYFILSLDKICRNPMKVFLENNTTVHLEEWGRSARPDYVSDVQSDYRIIAAKLVQEEPTLIDLRLILLKRFDFLILDDFKPYPFTVFSHLIRANSELALKVLRYYWSQFEPCMIMPCNEQHLRKETLPNTFANHFVMHRFNDYHKLKKFDCVTQDFSIVHIKQPIEVLSKTLHLQEARKATKQDLALITSFMSESTQSQEESKEERLLRSPRMDILRFAERVMIGWNDTLQTEVYRYCYLLLTACGNKSKNQLLQCIDESALPDYDFLNQRLKYAVLGSMQKEATILFFTISDDVPAADALNDEEIDFNKFKEDDSYNLKTIGYYELLDARNYRAICCIAEQKRSVSEKNQSIEALKTKVQLLENANKELKKDDDAPNPKTSAMPKDHERSTVPSDCPRGVFFGNGYEPAQLSKEERSACTVS